MTIKSRRSIMYKKEYILQGIKSKKNGNLVLLPNIFYNIETTIENVKYTIQDNSDNLKIILESQIIDNRKLDEAFFELYAYINIVIGYCPELLRGVEFDVKCLVEKYKTGEKHIYNDVCFICRITSNKFKKSYEKFLKIYREISFQLDYFSVATSKIGDFYCQIAIVNILQCLDGLYECLEITKNSRKYLTGTQAKKAKEIINSSKIQSILENESKEKRKELENKLKERIKESICRLEEENYITKLTNLFNDIENKYRVFHFENDENFREFIVKCKRTRNKFSHASNKNNNEFDGKESAFYLYKLILVFRLLIIDEIGLNKLIDRELLKKLIINIDLFKCNMLVNKYLNKEGENNGE